VKIYANGYGAPFGKVKAVKFGPLEAAFKFDSHGNLSAVSPSGLEAGTVYVTVTTNGGTSETGARADAFKVVPSVGGVTPNGGSKAGGETVTVTGTGFAVGAGLTAFKFGSGKASGVDCPSTTECTMVVPKARAAGVVDLKATASKASSAKTAADHFTYS
jgi:hypothetical protein